MQLFKAFLKIAKANLPGISVYFAVYVALTFLLGTTSQQNIDANFQSSALDICIIDEDQSMASDAIENYLASIHNLVEVENDPSVLQDHLYYRSISYILTIPEGFEEKLLAGNTDDLYTYVAIPGSTTCYFVNQQITQFTQTLQIYLAGGYSLKDAIRSCMALTETSHVNNLSFNDGNVVEKKEIYYFYQYLPYIFIVLLISGMAPIIIKFQEKDILARNSCSAEPLTSRNFQIALGCICYSALAWIVFQLLAFIAYGKICLTGNALYAMLNSFVFLLVAASVTFFASNFSIDDNVAHMIGNTLGLGMSFLCGVFVPQAMLSDGVLNVARFLPMYWYIRANNMLAGFGTEAFNTNVYWSAIGIQLLFAAAFFTFALVASRIKRQNA